MSEGMDKKLDMLIERHKELGDMLAQPDKLAGGEFAKVSKEYSDLSPIVETALSLKEAQVEQADAKEMMDDADGDAEMKALAQEEYYALQKVIPKLEEELQIALLPKDEADAKNAVIEIRAGTGGDEAALFAGDLYRMYQRYAERQGWTFEYVEGSDSESGGYKEVVASISGKNVFRNLKFESGVHRVQRVPETESQGRVHTSAATVAVLPEAEDVDIEIRDEDIRIDTMRSSGAGGQHVNTTDSAVRITHLPTGVVVTASEKSQHQNRAKAMQMLRTKLYDAEREKLAKERSDARKGQVGSGDRSERIRTYNFPQGRMSDHRINLTLYKLDGIMDGEIQEIVDALAAEDQAAKLAAMGDE